MKEDIKKSLNSLKMLGIDMISVAQSGHPGIVLGAAPIIYALYANILNHNPEDPNWINRDRFILSAGHGSALLYATLYMAGYNITLDDLTKFRQIDSITPGHPEYKKTPGVEMTTGPLGQGLASAVGIALSERYIRSLLNEQVPKQKLIDYYTYVLCSDGDLMEGISYEAAAFAGQQGLGKLIVLYDSNDITLDGERKISSNEDVIKRFDAIGWHVDYVKDGSDINSITKAISRAKRITNKPSIIEIKTILGRGSFNENKNIVHGKPLTKDDINNLRKNFGISTQTMEVEKDAIDIFRKTINNRINKYYKSWNNYYTKFKTSKDSEIQKILKFLAEKDISLSFDARNFKIQALYKEELRESNSKILNIISDRTPFFVGGSADLATSCKTIISKSMEMTKYLPLGKNIYFGVREHGMGAILNGMALNGLRVYGSTFLVFADYLKPAIRLSAMMNLPVTYIFTHDSINIGQDGPTHQPIEQLTMLRCIPNLDVYRPADINEVIGAWDCIISRQKPAALVISKKTVEILETTDSLAIKKGAYIVKKETANLSAIIIATGTEVTTAIEIANELSPSIRVVSMPSINIFMSQPKEYQEEIIPTRVKKISLEAGSTMSWNKIANYQIGIEEFGASGNEYDVLTKMNFSKDQIKERISKIINN